MNSAQVMALSVYLAWVERTVTLSFGVQSLQGDLTLSRSEIALKEVKRANLAMKHASDFAKGLIQKLDRHLQKMRLSQVLLEVSVS